MMKIIRHTVQIIFFIILPGLYINAFSGIKEIYTSVLGGSFDAVQMLPQLVEAIVIIPFTALFGRFFCGWMCAFGSFGDFMYGLSRRFFKVRFRMDEGLDRALKYVKYAVLLFLVAVLWTFNSEVFDNMSPWDAFGMLTTIGKAPAISYVAANLAVGLILFLLITAASFFVERFFCRYLCPLGAVFALTSKLRIAKIGKPKSKCGACRICTSSCAMGIPLYKTDGVGSGECIQCMRCVSVCPRKNVSLNVSETDVRPAAAGIAVAAAMTGLYYAGSIGANAVAASSAGAETSFSVTSQSSQSASDSLYLDGTYTGTGTGFRGATTTVSVTVKNGQITDIETVSHGDDAPYYSRAFSSVVEQIIDSQSTDVNAVSGATFSSDGIMSAVDDALSGAKVTSTASSSTSSTASTSSGSTSSSSTSSSSTSSSLSADQSAYKDGTYEGSGTGFRGATTTVSVTVENGRITDITTLSHGDDAPYYNRSFSSVVQQIINSQSTDVNAVSGATFSSNGIMSAVEDALNQS
ncbi:MAG: 4Fe-4S binding domain/FMN-binding protein [Firmicutes bacterium]|nr:4Fe-4S binding domain/FMN-binding protein [Bacillota bacterium]